jgi:hypothetical protein
LCRSGVRCRCQRNEFHQELGLQAVSIFNYGILGPIRATQATNHQSGVSNPTYGQSERDIGNIIFLPSDWPIETDA